MKFNKILFVAALSLATCMSAKAQDEVETEYVFNPHWNVQVQAGFQHTLGEIDWNKLNSFNGQVTLGYDWSAVWGARLGINAWQSKAGIPSTENLAQVGLKDNLKWKYNYVAPTLDLTMNVSNLIAGFNPNRIVNVSVFAGIGANIGFNNDEAVDINNSIVTTYPNLEPNDPNYLRYIWDGNKTRFVGQWGADIDFKCNDRVSIVVEAQWNTLSDHYNSKKAGNADWYFNTLAGIKINLGKTHSTRSVAKQPCEPQIVEKEVIKEVIKEVPVEKEIAREKLRRDIFFVIRGSEISTAEMPKLEEVAAYLNKYPEAKVTITGYADKGTGNAKVNQKYSEARAKMVAETLENKFGIASSRISYSAKGDTEQPYEKNELNRVSICVAE